MGEKPIKVDEATDRVVTELAFFLRTTKKSVVATAVADYASRAGAYRHRIAASDGHGVLGLSAASGGPDTPETPEPPTVLALAPLDRLALRRDELIRAFAARQACEIRVAELEPEWMGVAELVLSAETDPIMSGTGEAMALSRIASKLLHLRVEVQSLTTLRLFAPATHRNALGLSRPL